MLLSIAILVVLILLAVALFPGRKREGQANQSGNHLLPTLNRQVNLREQQLEEEAEAIASEYRRRADELWLAEVNEKAATLLKVPAKSNSKTTRSS